MSFRGSSPPTCGQFPASFLAFIDQTIDSPDAFVVADPEYTFFKEVLGFRDDDIQHTIGDAIQFFNESYGLDFSFSPPNDQNEYFYQNAKLSSGRFAADVIYWVTLNNWIQTGSTRSTNYRMRDGGFQVTFSGDQLLHGSYGGADGVPIGGNANVIYGFYSIEVCDQSPIVIQFKSATPTRQEAIDGTLNINLDIYNRVLGYGKAQGFFNVIRDTNNPDKFRLVTRNIMTFEVN